MTTRNKASEAAALPPREVRIAAGLSLIAAAVGAGAAEGTTRLYEANPLAVSPKPRARLDAFYSGLRERVLKSAEARTA